MLSNAYLLAKFRFDTTENERQIAEIFGAGAERPRRGPHLAAGGRAHPCDRSAGGDLRVPTAPVRAARLAAEGVRDSCRGLRRGGAARSGKL